MKFRKNEFIHFMLENNVIKFFSEPVKLKSGRYSYFYINWRSVTNSVRKIDKLCDYLINFIDDNEIEFDCLFGIPEGATKIAVITQYKYAKRCKKKRDFLLAMGRGKIKDHGLLEDRYFIGVPKGRVIIIEDVVTTGNSVLKWVNIIQEIGANIVGVIALTDRYEKGLNNKHISEILKEMKIPYHYLVNALEILPKAFEFYNVEPHIIKEVIRYYEKYGVNKLVIEKKNEENRYYKD